MSEITGWFTMNGNHIPIMKGEGKARAVARFLKGKRQARKMKREDDWNEKGEDLSYEMQKEHFRKYRDKDFKNQADLIDHMIKTGRMNEDLYFDMSDTKKDKSEFGQRLNKYMTDKYGKNYDKLSDRTIKGYDKDYVKENVISAKYGRDKYNATNTEWTELYKRGTAKYKLKEDKPSGKQQLANQYAKLSSQYNKLVKTSKETVGQTNAPSISQVKKDVNKLFKENEKLYRNNGGFARLDDPKVKRAQKKWLSNKNKANQMMKDAGVSGYAELNRRK